MSKKNEEWHCEKVKGNNEWECDSNRGTGVSLGKNGAVRFSKFDCDKPVRVNGKIIKKGKEELCGVELDQMKTKNKNRLGSILIWTALSIFGVQILYLLTQGSPTLLKTGLGNAILWVMLVVGGNLMRR